MIEERRPFGSRRTPREDRVKDDDVVAPVPVPVLHVGEVHAELRLHITDDTLSDLGSQIASLIANAARDGFRAGMETAMAEMDDDDQDDPAGFDPAGAPPPGPTFPTLVRDPGPALTEDDLRRARGQ